MEATKVTDREELQDSEASNIGSEIAHKIGSRIAVTFTEEQEMLTVEYLLDN